MIRKAALPLLAFSLLAFGCAGSRSEQREQQSTQALSQTPMCPMAVPGAQVETAPTDDGVAITFTTREGGQVDELRRRARAMAERHNAAVGADGKPSGGPTPGPGCPPSKARVEDVDTGARVVFTPNDPANLEALRTHVGQRVAMMQKSGGCPMAQAGACPHAQQGGGGCKCAQGSCPHAKEGGKGCPGMQQGGCPHCKGGGAGAPQGQGCPGCPQQPTTP